MMFVGCVSLSAAAVYCRQFVDDDDDDDGAVSAAAAVVLLAVTVWIAPLAGVVLTSLACGTVTAVELVQVAE